MLQVVKPAENRGYSELGKQDQETVFIRIEFLGKELDQVKQLPSIVEEATRCVKMDEQ